MTKRGKGKKAKKAKKDETFAWIFNVAHINRTRLKCPHTYILDVLIAKS